MPSTSYGADNPPPAAPYGAPPVTPYGAPQAPVYNPNLAYGQPQFVPPPQPQKKANGCVIAAVIVIALVVLIGGGIVALVAYSANRITNTVNNSLNSVNATLTADAGTAGIGSTPTNGSNSSGVPSASQISATAAANIFNIKTADQVDSNYKPTHVTNSFTTSSTIYLTYDHGSKAGYIIEKTYDSTGTIVIQSNSPHSVAADISNGYLSLTNVDPGNYTTGIYWCTQSDCSDAGLAQVVTFTVS